MVKIWACKAFVLVISIHRKCVLPIAVCTGIVPDGFSKPVTGLLRNGIEYSVISEHFLDGIQTLVFLRSFMKS